MYTGQKIRLREYRREDIPTVLQMINDSEIKRLLTPGIPYLYTLEDETKWFESLSANNDHYSFAIETITDNHYIGGCGINQIDWKNSITTVGIFIGDKDCWNKGYGTDAMKVLIQLIFEQLNINKIKLHVYEFNERAIKCYEKCGFKIEGTLRQEIFRDGKYHDEFIMSILKEEYLEF